MTRRISLLLFATLLAGACATSEVRLGTPIDCATTKHGRLLLFAQAVPTAELIPCVDELAAGWQIKAIATRSGEAVITFENDTFDVEARGTLTASCATSGPGEPTPDPLVTAHPVAVGTVAFTFSGGCFLVETPEAMSDEVAAELTTTVQYLSRDQLRTVTGWIL